MDAPFKLLVWVAAMVAAGGAGLVGGVFFAFSSFIMKGLARLPAQQGIAAMQSINITVISPLFMGVFLGMALCSVLLGTYSLTSLQRAGSIHLLIASVLYLSGFATTLLFNVPLNNALAQTDPASIEAAQFWSGYIESWTLWNHVRAVTCVAAAVMFVVAIFRIRGSS